MTISKHEQQQRDHLFEAFKNFSNIYRSKVEFTGEKLRKVADFTIPMDPSKPIIYKEVDEISIKMPQDEYEKFLINWSQYIDLMMLAQQNPMIREEFLKLNTLVQLLK